jgi:hypothetical protein
MIGIGTLAAKSLAARSYFVAQVAATDDPIDENAASAFRKSCYKDIDWKIDQDESVSVAIKRMTAGELNRRCFNC